MTALTERQQNLIEAVSGLVPLCILEMRDLTFEQRKAALDVEAVTTLADGLQYGSGAKPTKAERDDSRRALNALVKGLAAGAYQPGGVTFAGLHWCVDRHCGCPTWPRAVCPVPCRTGCELRAAAESGGDRLTPPPVSPRHVNALSDARGAALACLYLKGNCKGVVTQ